MRGHLCFVLVLFAPACVRVPNGEFVAPPEETGEESPRESTVVRDVVVEYEGSGDEAPGDDTSVASAPAGNPPLHHPVLFSLGAGHGALGRVDLAACRGQGLPPGYLHMQVTFRSSGRVVHAAVETPAPPPPEALACIGEQLELAMVPIFDGDDVTLSKSFFVN